MQIKRYTADFETCTWLEDETYVWAWALCEIGGKYNIKTGTDIEMFIKNLEYLKNTYIYFHNLKFDGEFVVYYLLQNGFEPLVPGEEKRSRTFDCLISEMGMWYSIDIYFEVNDKQVISKTKLIDSLKIIPFAVDFIASKKCFNLPIQKLEIDYNEYRERDHKLTKEEQDYISNDVKIVALALNEFFKKGLKKMTGGANALADFKKILGKEKYEYLFPKIPKDVDEDIRKAYRGGFTYLNPAYEGKVTGKGVVLDVNSLYPSVMYDEFLPYGDPVFFEGEYERDDYYPLYIQRITCTFKIKENKIPTIQIKNNTSYFIPNEYIEYSGSDPVALTLTSVDLELFFMQYEVYDLEYQGGWKFKAVKGAFTEYIDKWTKEKIEAGKKGNSGLRTIAKRMLNSLYGKLASSLKGNKKIPYVDENGIVQYYDSEPEERKGVYLPARLLYNFLCKI